MQCDAVKFANEALDHHLTYADMAIFIKNKFEGQHGGKWCCVVGFDADIGSTVSHKPDIYFHRGELGIVLFKTEVFFFRFSYNDLVESPQSQFQNKPKNKNI